MKNIFMLLVSLTAIYTAEDSPSVVLLKLEKAKAKLEQAQSKIESMSIGQYGFNDAARSVAECKQVVEDLNKAYQNALSRDEVLAESEFEGLIDIRELSALKDFVFKHPKSEKAKIVSGWVRDIELREEKERAAARRRRDVQSFESEKPVLQNDSRSENGEVLGERVLLSIDTPALGWPESRIRQLDVRMGDANGGKETQWTRLKSGDVSAFLKSGAIQADGLYTTERLNGIKSVSFDEKFISDYCFGVYRVNCSDRIDYFDVRPRLFFFQAKLMMAVLPREVRRFTSIEPYMDTVRGALIEKLGVIGNTTPLHRFDFHGSDTPGLSTGFFSEIWTWEKSGQTTRVALVSGVSFDNCAIPYVVCIEPTLYRDYIKLSNEAFDAEKRERIQRSDARNW